MKIRFQKQLLQFLNKHANILETFEENNLENELCELFQDNQLREIVVWLYPKKWKEKDLQHLSRNELLNKIECDYNILQYLIDTLEKGIVLKPQFTQEEVNVFFSRTQNEMHYLASKDVKTWDEYDLSNYQRLLFKSGTTKVCYGIFDSDVLAKDVHTVTTKPSFYFDTEEEAKDEIHNIVSHGDFKSNELVVHKVYLFT